MERDPIDRVLMRWPRELRERVRLDQLEASVRRDESGDLGCGRMMIERAEPGLIEWIARALEVDATPGMEVARAAERVGVPIILGWDFAARCAKVYANASDASQRVRQELRNLLGLSEPAHVVGVNFGERVEWKRYTQLPVDEVELTADSLERALLERALAEGIAAGVVTSHDIVRSIDRAASTADTARALFIALRPSTLEAIDRALGVLPGYRGDEVRNAFPYEPDYPRSVGVDLRNTARWTVYAKARHADALGLASVEPVARFRLGDDAELGVHVDRAERRYAQIGDGLSVSYRVREGEAPGEQIETLMAWVMERLNAGDAIEYSDPPLPWTKTGDE